MINALHLPVCALFCKIMCTYTKDPNETDPLVYGHHTFFVSEAKFFLSEASPKKPPPPLKRKKEPP